MGRCAEEGRGLSVLTIRLFCNQGMSTSLLVNKMREAAMAQGIEVDIVAYPVGEFKDRLKGADVALLGPQVAYLKPQLAKDAKDAGVPMDVIPMRDYGICNGEGVLKFARKLAGR